MHNKIDLVLKPHRLGDVQGVGFVDTGNTYGHRNEVGVLGTSR